MTNLLESLDEKLSENLQKHGHYLTDPHAGDEEKLNGIIDGLAAFVPEDRWPQVREELLNIIRSNQVSR
ncbi:hypothetical protein AA309_10600 [Microvirga vignae]|uniref:Uncharacterized protein n=1 Tax=Microvirga vignae TaxID=1225564 RepID=A0A0H1RCU2_9HYPH|nr:hypothetical protein [Microvirga vignae]KLK93023.1 hypothetical protein AA309_10600 [Microvirga vignae]